MKSLPTFVAAAAVLLTSTSALAEEAPRSTTPVVKSAPAAVQVADDKPGFIDMYFPLGLPDALEPEVDSSVALIWILSVLPLCAPLWAPAVLTGQGYPDDYFVDLLISGILHFASQFIPVVGFCLGPLNCFYFCPVATIAIYDRNLKQQRRGGRRALHQGPPDAAPQEPILSLNAMAY